MARILICHVPKDGGTARDLGATLMGRGHFVSFDGEPDTPRPDRSSRLRQFEAVIVLWSESSAQNPGLTEIAREALPLNLLVPVRPSELDAGRLPLMFRKLNMFPPRDIDGIARMIGRLSAAASSLREFAASSRENAETQRRTGAAPVANSPVAARKPAQTPVAKRSAPGGAQPEPTLEAKTNIRVRPLSDLPEVEAGPFERREPTLSPQGPFDPGAPGDRGQYRASGFDRPSVGVITAEDLTKAVEAGLLLHHIPEAMGLGSLTTVELTLDRDVLAGLSQPEVGQSVETLSISLYGASEVFEIERQSERTQFVTAKHMMQARDPATVGRWAWLVTPRALGPQDLVVRISALLRDRRGVPAPVALPDRRFSVEIQAPEGESLISALAGWRRR
ncbi:hypothetical protein [Hyphomicrobium sp.]|uniref:hypothetical protein n=1 Tax=Hyphomicrobium sp. TaxID=82 RepID=UPI002E35495D|nr:hypothetical protein [Hyphomicrobium sp.]HEX2840368.1 hypothetical protein [Hyphomicrobium sp.]